jgi:murein DD-endopeptidase MepM/ murein hydrolase activator NlpD
MPAFPALLLALLSPAWLSLPSSASAPVFVSVAASASAPVSVSVAASAFAPVSVFAAAAARYRWPVDVPQVTRRFEPPPQPWLAGHRGVDLAAPPGTTVRAAGSGTVGYAGTIAGRGVVSITHPGGLRTTYEPVSAAVHQGDAVAAGEVIGLVAAGHPGCPAAACLHWGLRRGDTYLDPLALLGLGRVRLLPLDGRR